MRIWDLPPRALCRQHLLGEHRELHGLWNILRLRLKGYSRHPETLRWVGKTRALAARHERLVAEMARRGYGHATPLPDAALLGPRRQTARVQTLAEQRARLRGKGCECRVT